MMTAIEELVGSNPLPGPRPVTTRHFQPIRKHEKLCRTCERVLPKTAFATAVTGDGLSHECRECSGEAPVPVVAAEEALPTPAIDPDDELVSQSEAIRRLRVPPATFRAWRQEVPLTEYGPIPGRYPSVLLSWKACQALAAERAESSPAPDTQVAQVQAPAPPPPPKPPALPPPPPEPAPARGLGEVVDVAPIVAPAVAPGDELISRSEAMRRTKLRAGVLLAARKDGRLTDYGHIPGRGHDTLLFSWHECRALAEAEAARRSPTDQRGKRPADPDLVTLSEAAAQVERPYKTLCTWLRAGLLDKKAVRGRTIFVSMQQVLALAAARRQPTPAAEVAPATVAAVVGATAALPVVEAVRYRQGKVAVVADRAKGLLVVLVGEDELHVPGADLDALLAAVQAGQAFLEGGGV
jgi:hypothetical protein